MYLPIQGKNMQHNTLSKQHYYSLVISQTELLVNIKASGFMRTELILCLASPFPVPHQTGSKTKLDPSQTMAERPVGESQFVFDSRMCNKKSQVLVLVLDCLLDGRWSVQASSLPLQALFCCLQIIPYSWPSCKGSISMVLVIIETADNLTWHEECSQTAALQHIITVQDTGD